LNLSARLVVIVAILVAVLIIGVYAVTVLFTQTVPSTTVKGPSGSPSAVGDCSTLTNSPATITLSSGSSTQGEINMTCSGGAAFSVTSEGSFTPSFSCSYGYFSNCGTGYVSLTVFNYTSWKNQGCSTVAPNGYSITYPGAFITLSKGDYVYCVSYLLGPYSTSSPTSLPSFTIAWNSP
jgi:hypothetical protein